MTSAIVILNWNGRDFLERYLPSVVNSVKGIDGVRVIVADNASNDDSVAFLKSAFPSVEIIQLRKNHGFAIGYNKALEKVDADCYLLLNSDVEVPPEWFLPLKEWMELHPDCGICGPKLHRIDQRDAFEYAGAAGGYIDRFGYPFCRGRVMKRLENDEGQYDIPADVMWVSGAALMIRSQLFHSLGGFCKDFVAHMEEIDLCWRARLEGWRVCVVPRSTVYHVGGGTLGNESPHKLYLNYRNNLLMLRRNLARTYALCCAFCLMHRMTDPDEGPDELASCREVYLEMDRQSRKDIAVTCAAVAHRQAQMTIFYRKLLDGISAAVYLLQGKTEYFKAVTKAHRDYAALKPKVNCKAIAKYLIDIFDSGEMLPARNMLFIPDGDNDNFGVKDIRIRGMWRKWIVWQSMMKKDAIFSQIKDRLV